MANVLTSRPVKVDTVMTVGHQASVGAQAGNTLPLHVRQVVWDGATTVGHKLTIVDPITGNILATATADAINKSIILPVNATWADYKVSVIQSGTVFIHA